MKTERVVLVAFTVNAVDAQSAQTFLMGLLPRPSENQVPDVTYLSDWWVAEDERYDRSDNDSAVFVPMGDQAKWSRKVYWATHEQPEQEEGRVTHRLTVEVDDGWRDWIVSGLEHVEDEETFRIVGEEDPA